VKPQVKNFWTCAEWPAVQQDLRSAYERKNYPFFDGVDELIAYASITFNQCDLEDLEDELRYRDAKKDVCVVIASCPDDLMNEARRIVTGHNKHAMAKVKIAWATSHDVYGSRTDKIEAAAVSIRLGTEEASGVRSRR
jgi:hypothetical protein